MGAKQIQPMEFQNKLVAVLVGDDVDVCSGAPSAIWPRGGVCSSATMVRPTRLLADSNLVADRIDRVSLGHRTHREVVVAAVREPVAVICQAK